MIICRNKQKNLFGENITQNNDIKINTDEFGLQIKTPYSAKFLEDLKREIPYQFRMWDADLKIWRVANQFAEKACEIIELNYGYCPEIKINDSNSKFQSQTYLIEYIGRSKERDDSGESFSLGFCQNAWNIVFPEKALKEFFEGKADDQTVTTSQNNKLTFYQLLGIKQSCVQKDIKSAYRRMAKQWHPDVCSEPDARDRFENIKTAYQTLSEPIMRKRYNAGLMFEKEANKTNKKQSKLSTTYGYAPPLRCGLITIDGEYSVGKIIVSKIHAWDDWQKDGKTAVASWDTLQNEISIKWV